MPVRPGFYGTEQARGKAYKYAVSACLVGEQCKYNGGHNRHPVLARMYGAGRVLAVCPECMAGLGVPRPQTEIVGGAGAEVLCGTAAVHTREGRDVSLDFIRGAQCVLDAMRSQGIQAAILKARSPSCGYGCIYDGTFSGTLRAGNGVCAQLLRDNGIMIQTEEGFDGIING